MEGPFVTEKNLHVVDPEGREPSDLDDLIESERLYRLLAENTGDLITRHKPDGLILYASPSCQSILGYEPDGERGFKSLVIATDLDGELRCVGRVGSGLTEEHKRRLWPRLQARRRATPWLEAGIGGNWVEPGLYCQVSYLERTASGSLRAPVFLQWSEG